MRRNAWQHITTKAIHNQKPISYKKFIYHPPRPYQRPYGLSTGEVERNAIAGQTSNTSSRTGVVGAADGTHTILGVCIAFMVEYWSMLCTAVVAIRS